MKAWSDERRQAAFWAKVDRRGPDECWPWLASKNWQGYGKFNWGYPKLVAAHRAAFFYAHGRWPDVACHTCDNPSCVNPAHIYDGDKSSNLKDFYQRDPRAAEIRRQTGERLAERNRKRSGEWRGGPCQ